MVWNVPVNHVFFCTFLIVCPLKGVCTCWSDDVLRLVPLPNISSVALSLASHNQVCVASEIFCTETFGRNSVRILNRGRYVCRQVSSKERGCLMLRLHSNCGLTWKTPAACRCSVWAARVFFSVELVALGVVKRPA